MRFFLFIVLIGLGPAATVQAQAAREPQSVTARLLELDGALGLTASQEGDVRALLVARNAFYARWAVARLEAKRNRASTAVTGLRESKVQEKAQFDADLRRLLSPAQQGRYERFRATEQAEAQRLIHGG